MSTATDQLADILTDAYGALAALHPGVHRELPDVRFVPTFDPPSPWCKGLDSPGVEAVGIPVAAAASSGPNLAVAVVHAAAHLLAAARGIKVTTRQGRYHNGRFDDALAEFGDVHDGDQPHTEGILRSLTPVLLADARAEYTAHQSPPARNLPRATCGCDRIIRASHAVLDGPPIMCLACDEPFRAVTG